MRPERPEPALLWSRSKSPSKEDLVKWVIQCEAGSNVTRKRVTEKRTFSLQARAMRDGKNTILRSGRRAAFERHGQTLCESRLLDDPAAL